MKIPKEKQIAFLEKVLKETQNHAGAWNRVASQSVAAINVFQDSRLDPEGTYYYRLPDSIGGEFWLAMCRNGRVRGAIGTDSAYMEYFDDTDEKIEILLTRIFYLLFGMRPSAKSLIDDFLAM